MKMRPLIITEETQQKIFDLIEFAEESKIPLSEMKKIAAGILPPVGDFKTHSIEIPFNYRIVFSIEEHPGGWFKHLSISVPGRGNYPSVPSVEIIASQFDMPDLKQCYVYAEEGVEAINVLSRIN